MASPERAKTLRKKPIYLKGFGERSNPSYGPRAGSDALVMGVKDAGKVAMEMAGVKHSDINFLQLYDDYIIVVYLQIEDLGFCAKGDREFLRAHRFYFQRPTADPNRRRHDQRRPAVDRRRHFAHHRSACASCAAKAASGRCRTRRPDWSAVLGVLPYGKNLGCCAVAVLRKRSCKKLWLN